MALPNSKILYASGRPLTVADVNREFCRMGYADGDRRSNSEVMQMLQIRSDCWNDVLMAGFPAGGTVAEQKAWLLSKGWATSFDAPLPRETGTIFGYADGDF